MALTTNFRRVVIAGAGSLALLFTSNCNKLDTKEPIIFRIRAEMPFDHFPVAGVKYTIVEYKQKGKFGSLSSGKDETGWKMEGHTNENGVAAGAFQGKLKSNYSYTITFDYSSLDLPAGTGSYSVIGPSYDLLSRSSPGDNMYDIRILPKCYVHFKVENTSCASSADSMRFMSFNADEFPNKTFQSLDWGPYFVGCGLLYDSPPSQQVLSGHWLYKIETRRNGIIETTVDTFNLQPNITNEVFLQY